jgi:hypothetical protein
MIDAARVITDRVTAEKLGAQGAAVRQRLA